MKKIFKSKLLLQVIIASVVATLATAVIVSATTTIGTNIATGGHMTVAHDYGLDATTAGVLNIGTTTATTINIGGTQATTIVLGKLQVPNAYGLDVSSSGVLSIGTTTATTINIGGTQATTNVLGLFKVPAAYGLDTSAAGALNIGTTTANAITIGKSSNTTNFPGYVTMTNASTTNASTTLASFGSSGTTVAGLLFGTCVVNPQSITAATSSLVSTSCLAAGLPVGYKVFVTPPADGIVSGDNWLVFKGASASTTANYIEISLFNASTTADIDGPSKTWSWMAIK